MVRVKSIPKKIPKPKPKLKAKESKKILSPSFPNLLPIPSRTSLALSTIEPDISLPPETQQVASTEPSSLGVVNAPPVSPPVSSKITTKKGPKEHINYLV